MVGLSPSYTIGQGFEWPRQSSGCLADELKGANILRDLLSSHFRNCRSFLIRTYDEYFPSLETDCLVPSDTVNLIVCIIAEAGLEPRSITIRCKDNGNGRLDTRRLPISLCKTPRFVEAWSQIEELRLEYRITSDQLDWVTVLISSAPRLRNLLLFFDSGDISSLRRLSVLQGLDKLKELQLKQLSTTVDHINSILLRNRDSLHLLSLYFVHLDGKEKWSTVFKNMENQFPNLQNLDLFWLRQGDARNRVVFSQFLQYPRVPGSEIRGSGDRIKYERRRIGSMEDAVTLRHWGITGKKVTGVKYNGKEINHVLSALVNTVETD